MLWFIDYCNDAEKTDQLTGHPDHVALLAAGLFGETGSILAELKKTKRETEAYPFYRDRLMEEDRRSPLVLRPSGDRSGFI